MIDLTGKTALVTAGSRGLGAEIVMYLARCGANVAFTYLKDVNAAEKLAEEVQALGRTCLAVQADVGDFAATPDVVEKVQRDCGGLHILVCNAGIARGAALWKMSESDWDIVINTTLKGAFNYLHAVAPTFIEQRYGKVVCVGSINGLRGRVGTISYNVAKAGLVGLVKTAAAELGQYNVNVNLVAPGFIETPSQVNTPEIVRDMVLKECAIKRLATPKEIVPLIAFLCGDESRHVTGQTIKVDGGQYL